MGEEAQEDLKVYLFVAAVVLFIAGVITLMVLAAQPLTAGYVTALSHDPGHSEEVCTSYSTRVCFSYRKEWIEDVYIIDISSCDLPTVRAGGTGAFFCKYNVFSVSAAQYARARIGRYIDLSRVST